MPLIVHSICRAPARTAASEFAVASPRSLWQCTLMIARPFTARAMRPISSACSSSTE